MRGFLSRLFSDLHSVWENPQADPQRTVVFLGGGVILVLILVVVLLLLVTGEPERQRTRRIPWRQRIAFAYLIPGILLALLGVFVGTDEFATAPSTCATCHEIGPSLITWSRGAHAGTDCMRCHGDGGALGFAATRVRGLDNLLTHYLRRTPRLTTVVPNNRCLECHAAVREGSQDVRGVRVRHRDFLAAGASCLDCHGGLGHLRDTGFVNRPTMDKCIACHDGTTAPSACATCHTADVAVAREIPDSYPKVHLGERRTCEGCHSTEPCRKCHGLDMPHPPDFATPEQHAPLAAFEGKQKLCYRCHEEADCRRCHQPFASHGPKWKQQHGLAGRSPDLRCKDCHSRVQAAIMCDLCHRP